MAEVSTDAGSYVFRVLGPLEVTGSSGRIDIPPGRQEVILAALVLNLNRVVDTAYLVDLVWAENPPNTARTQVQICVSRIRKALVTGGAGATIDTRARGYLLRASEEATDVGRFRRLVDDARELARAGRKAQAVAQLREAARLWRGHCLTGVPGEALTNAAVQLDESRIEALELCLRLELELGRHDRLIGELQLLAAEHPLRERLRGYLMLALHRSGRQAEALEVYRQARELLAEELGLDPGKELQDLANAILADDSALTVAAEIETREPAPAIEPKAATRPMVTPRQLPVDVVDFVADDVLIKGICTALTERQHQDLSGVVLLTGRPGVGKSTMAIHVAHRLASGWYPDGQLYCDLRGTSEQPLDPRQALGRFLRAMGIPGQGIPEPMDERAEMYRSLLAERRILVVLDDAAGEAQVRPLLPGSGRSAVVVTSRSGLTGLPGSCGFALEPLDMDRAVRLLGKVLGEQRIAAEADTARVLVRLVGGLPLALRIVAARLAARPHWSLASMVRRLEDEHRRLDELVHGELSIRASLALSYDGLAAADRRLLGLLALVDGTEIPNWVGAALTDDRGSDPAHLLEPLLEMRLLEIMAIDPAGEFRFELPQTVRMFAYDRLMAEVSAADRAAAVRRLVGGWTALAEYAHQQIYGGAYTIVPGRAEKWHLPVEYVQRNLNDPLGWLEEEHGNLSEAVELAARFGLDEACWQLATTLVALFEARGFTDLWESTHKVALRVVRESGNILGQAATLRSLGALHLNRGEYSTAAPYLDTASRIFEEIAEPTGRALCLRDQALIVRETGDDDRALALYERAERFFVTAGDIIGRAHVLGEMAYIHMRQSDFPQARSYLDEALGICRSAGFDRGQAMLLRRLGQMLTYQGELEAAERTFLEVLAMVRASGDIVGEGYLLFDLGRVNVQLFRVDTALQHFNQSITVREGFLNHKGAAAVHAEIAALLK
ncbi:BTAD domain-containing putative transcriptional regulator [Spongiactinospora sp. 9N601]|uniref:AfsR/SARP family transcriptional regulator n=1 Tax=Spongiactinospora sp. 9N601 TaxID=3375149 RepID=UPI0037B87127